MKRISIFESSEKDVIQHFYAQKKQILLSIAFTLCVIGATAQQKIKDGSVTANNLPNKDAIIEIESSNKGMLFSRIALQGTTVSAPLSGHVAGMMVYNTTKISDVVPGIYYNDGSRWILAGAGQASNISYNPTTFEITYVNADNKRMIINLREVVRQNQTITTLVNNNDGTYLYTSEDGTTTLINVPADVINQFDKITSNATVRQIIKSIVNVTGGNVSYDGSNFTYIDKNGVTQTINIAEIVKANETITTLIDNHNGTYTYKAEDGKVTIINVPADVINNFQAIANDNTVKQIIENIVKNTAGNVFYDGTNFTYIDNSGNRQTINIVEIVKANETITTLIDNHNGTYTYKAEDGKVTTINVPADVINNFQAIANDNTVKQIIENIVKNTAGNVFYDGTNFTYIDNSGTRKTVNISQLIQANETITTLVKNADGTYTYTNEKNDKVNIDVIGDAVNNITNEGNLYTTIKNLVDKTETVTSLTYDVAKNTLTYVNEDHVSNVIDLAALVSKNQLTTSLANGLTTEVTSSIPAANPNHTEYKVEVKNGAISTEKLADGAVSTEKIAVKAVTADKLGATPADKDKVGVVQADGSVVYQSLSTANIAGKDLTAEDGSIAITDGNGAVLTNTKLKVAEGGISTSKLADGAVNNTKIAADAVTTDKIKDGEVKTADLADKNITAEKLVALTTDKGKVATANADGTVSYQEINAGSLAGTKAITTDGIITVNNTNTLANSVLADAALSIADESITSSKIMDGAVTTADIADAAITTGKVNNFAVTAEKLNAGTGVGGRVATANADGTVTYQSVNAENLINGKNLTAADASIVVGTGTGATLVDANVKVADGGICTDKLANGAVTINKIAKAAVYQVMTTDDEGTPAWAPQESLRTAVSNTSAENKLSTTVNGTTGAEVNIINSNTLCLDPTGKLLTSTVNGIASAAVDISLAIAASQKTTTVSNGTNTTVAAITTGNITDYKVNVPNACVENLGVVKQAATNAAITINASGELTANANNGVTVANANIQLGGALNKPTTITATAANTLAVAGLQTGAVADNLVVADANGVLKQVKAAMPKFFYMPSMMLNTETIGATYTVNLYNEYKAQFTNIPAAQRSSSAADIPFIPTAAELDYYVTYFDNTVVQIISVQADGTLTYKVVAKANTSSFVTIVFVVK